MLRVMRLPHCILVSALLAVPALTRSQPAKAAFEVASIRPSERTVGPDYNNQIRWTPESFTARNATLRRLIADAWQLQLDQVIGPPWLDHNEYDIEARLGEGATEERKRLMLQSLLLDRFNLKQHRETRAMRVYELTVARDGPKIKPLAIKPAAEGEAHSGAGYHFHGDMRQFADLLAVQFSIPALDDPGTPVRAGGPASPVLDRTGLDGVYDFSVDVRPELGTDMFTLWQRASQDQLGLSLESRKEPVTVMVVDNAAEIPTAN
jgi:uncharacterized protein (TIGR03435 family)